MNESNLISLADRPQEERKAIASKGGKASVEARRRRKSFQETANILLSAPIKDKAVKEYLRQYGFINEDMNLQAQFVATLYNFAMNGNMKACELLINLVSKQDELITTNEAEEQDSTMFEILEELKKRNVAGVEDEEESLNF